MESPAAGGLLLLQKKTRFTPLTSPSICDNMKLASREVNFTKRGAGPIKTKVREMRTQAGLTQQQLAEMVRVSARTIISIEKEQYSPSLMLAYRLARVFGSTVEDLCCLEENRKKEDENYERLSK